jgi:hypothetical protein
MKKNIVIGIVFAIILSSCSSKVDTRVKTFDGSVQIHRLNRLYKNGDTVIIREMKWNYTSVTTGVVMK